MSRFLRPSGTKLSTDAVEQARLALSNFRALQPTLSAYARMLSGRPDIVVEASSTTNGSTDGKKIYYRPPISLGKVIAHARYLCDRRDSMNLMKCPACAQRENVLVTMYHEIAHIWFDSFKGITEDDKKRCIREAILERGDTYAEAIAKKLEDSKYTKHLGFMALAGFVSPFLPTLVNALEDARVNKSLFVSLPGTQVMFDANTAQIFQRGVEQPGKDGEWEYEMWADRPLNMQAMIGLFCMSSGYNFDSWLAPFVVANLADPQLVALVAELDDATSVDTVWRQAFPILARLRELGFFRSEEDPEDDFVPPYEEEDKDDSGTGTDDSSADGEEPSSDEASDEEGSGDGSDPEGSDDSDGGDSSEPSDGGEPGDSEEEVEDGKPDGGDSPGGRPEGSEDDNEDASEEAGGDRDSTGDPDSASSGKAGGGAEDSVSEEDRDLRGTGDATGDASDSDDSAGIRDGEGTGDFDLDGLDSPDSGESDDDEPGDRAESDGGSDREVELSGDEDGDDAELKSDPDVIDTGIFDKGTRVDGELPDMPKKPPIPWGTAEEVEIVVMELGDHEPPDSVTLGEDHSHGDAHRSEEDEAGDEVVKVVMVQGVYFEMPSQYIGGPIIFKEGDPYFDRYSGLPKHHRLSTGIDGEFDPPEEVIAPAIMRGRIVFAANARGKYERGRKSGRVHANSLGRKAPFNDPRMFEKKNLPGREDYLACIGIDVSGSTTGLNLTLAKQVAFAECEVLSRLGIPFMLYAHSGSYGVPGGSDRLDMTIFELKDIGEQWTDTTRGRLRGLGPDSANLDGHTMMFYRKKLEAVGTARTKKFLHYYSDGGMPAENAREERDIIESEILQYRRKGIILATVGIRTDSPRRHGLDCVQVNEQRDVIKVVDDLEKRFLKT